MYYLMHQMDSESDFQDFLGHYLKKYEYQSITFLETRLTFNEFVIKKYGKVKGQQIVDRIDWISWVQTPGPLPPNNAINFTTVNSVAFQDLADEYIRLGGNASPQNIDIYIKETKDVLLKVVFASRLLSR